MHNLQSGREVCTTEFVSMLLTESGIVPKETPIAYGRKQGWLEAIDELEAEQSIHKQRVARILHEFLRLELKERDEEDWGMARNLKDLYDCRVCANHVAQVYAKGIVPSEQITIGERTIELFDMKRTVTQLEAAGWISRCVHRKLRIL